MKASCLIESNNITALHHKLECRQNHQTFIEEPKHSQGILIMVFMARVKWNKKMTKIPKIGMKSMET